MNIYNPWHNTEYKLKDQQDCGINLFRDPKGSLKKNFSKYDISFE